MMVDVSVPYKYLDWNWVHPAFAPPLSGNQIWGQRPLENVILIQKEWNHLISVYNFFF